MNSTELQLPSGLTVEKMTRFVVFYDRYGTVAGQERLNAGYDHILGENTSIGPYEQIQIRKRVAQNAYLCSLAGERNWLDSMRKGYTTIQKHAGLATPKLPAWTGPARHLFGHRLSEADSTLFGRFDTIAAYVAQEEDLASAVDAVQSLNVAVDAQNPKEVLTLHRLKYLIVTTQDITREDDFLMEAFRTAVETVRAYTEKETLQVPEPFAKALNGAWKTANTMVAEDSSFTGAHRSKTLAQEGLYPFPDHAVGPYIQHDLPRDNLF